MFEKEAEEYKRNNIYNSKETGSICTKSIEEAFQDGATLGYNKANEWHYPSKGELPNCTRQVLICYGMEERMKFVYWRADLGTFGSALPIEITAWRYNHKLTEWHTFCDWIEGLPYAEELLIS